MSVRITYFVHGTSTDNEAGLSSGGNDPPLSALGVRQAEELKKILARAPLVGQGAPLQNDNRTFDAVFSSDLRRALRTAEIAFERKAPIIPDARLRECNYGTYNGKPSAIVEPMQEQNITGKFPDGESYEDVKKRIADFLRFLKREYDGKHVGIVSHKAPQLSLDILLKGKTWRQAFADDWRKTGAWQPRWKYELQ